jgi:hypothetical protein
MSGHKVFLHLGYGKTGTTTLQQSFFDRLHSHGVVFYFGMFLSDRSLPNNKTFFDSLTDALYLSDDEFNRELQGLRRLFEICVSNVPKAVPIVISNEHFLMSGYSTRRRGVAVSAHTTAKRLSRLFHGEEAKLIVALRRQDELMHSMFVEAVSRRNHQNHEHFVTLEHYLTAACNERSPFYLMYDFYASLSGYRDAFPKAPIMSYTFEEFRQNELTILQSMLSWMEIDPDNLALCQVPLPNLNRKSKSEAGISVNSYSGTYYWLRRAPGFQYLYPVVARNAALRRLSSRYIKPGTVPFLSHDEAKLIVETFRASNRRLLYVDPELTEQFGTFGYV